MTLKGAVCTNGTTVRGEDRGDVAVNKTKRVLLIRWHPRRVDVLTTIPTSRTGAFSRWVE
eukprot:1853430-Pyramimonas_sp.AAC.1